MELRTDTSHLLHNFTQNHGNPCVVPYDYIVKSETGTADKDYITKTILSGKVAADVHNHRGIDIVGSDSIDMYLPDFADVLPTHIDNLISYARRDMELFGYSFECNSTVCMAKCGFGSDCC